MVFIEIDEKEFIEFASNYEKRNFWQTAQMGTLREKKGWKKEYVAVKNAEGKIIGAAMLLSRATIFYFRIYQALRGFLIDYHNKEISTFFLKELKKYLKKKKCLYFSVDPYIPYIERDIDGNEVKDGFHNQDIIDMFLELGFLHKGFTKGFEDEVEPRWMFVLPLANKDKDTILKEMRHQTRWSIQRSLKYAIEIQELSVEELPIFAKLMDHTAGRRGFFSRDLSYYEEMYKEFGKEHIKYIVAKLNVKKWVESEKQNLLHEQEELKDVEEILAKTPDNKKHLKKRKVLLENIDMYQKKVMQAEQLLKDEGEELILVGAMFVLYGNEVIYLFSGAYEQYMQFRASYAMQWYMIQYAIDHGYTLYNFYGTSGIFDESAEDYGVYRFKCGFGGNVVELIGTFVLPVHRFWYFLYTKLKK